MSRSNQHRFILMADSSAFRPCPGTFKSLQHYSVMNRKGKTRRESGPIRIKFKSSPTLGKDRKDKTIWELGQESGSIHMTFGFSPALVTSWVDLLRMTLPIVISPYLPLLKSNIFSFRARLRSTQLLHFLKHTYLKLVCNFAWLSFKVLLRLKVGYIPHCSFF